MNWASRARAYDELDMYRTLRQPMTDLDGLTPIRWLILGRPVEAVIKLIIQETRPQPSQPRSSERSPSPSAH